MKPTYKLLKEVRELIKTPGRWGKGSYHRNGKYCLMGALQHADLKQFSDAYRSAKVKLMKVISTVNEAASCSGIVKFNDLPSTTHEDVIRVLNKALRASR
jgi:hypothetical protein